MTDCHGFELGYAKEVLESEGFLVYLKEVRSKKGVDGDSRRVVRQRKLDEKSVELCYSVVLTYVKSSKSE